MLSGKITRIAGPVVVADGLKGVRMYEVVHVGAEHLVGEVIQIIGESAVIQVYEETAGIAPGDEVVATGAPLSVELGPGLLSTIYDGVQRPLRVIQRDTGTPFLHRGVTASPLDRERKWAFTPELKKGDKVTGGEVVGTIPETTVVTHRVLVPPGLNGTVVKVSPAGEYTVDEVIAVVETTDGTKELTAAQKWPVRTPRPNTKKLDPSIPLLTGQRILDTFFPMAKGGTGAIPGGFGTGKTVTQQQLAKWADADIVLYIGCGERGNEMTEVLDTFPNLIDPKSGKPLMERTIIIANTSNMPVAAREASVYTGMTLAEYYRDMGYSVAIMADSTSRWAEAMREISGRLEEMPGEEGYPAYLPTRLAQFYERAGRVTTLGGAEGSVSVVGAVSPPGGDFSEPVTQGTLRVVKVFWALDKSLASRRHFPAIGWLDSYSLYLNSVTDWYVSNAGEGWRAARDRSLALLQKEQSLQEIVQLVGPDALPESERLVLEVTRIIREDFLQQNAYHPEDSFCPIAKQVAMLQIALAFYDMAIKALESGVSVERIAAMKIKDRIARLKEAKNATFEDTENKVMKEMREEFAALGGEE